MIKRILPILCGIVMCTPVFAQLTSIDVTEQTIKIGARDEEEIYLGFAEGDQVTFNFEVLNGKQIQELEIIELPSSSRFMDFKIRRLNNKAITISRTGIYKFRFKNSAWSKRVCRFKVQRIPATEATKAFNTAVYWRTVNDTTWKAGTERYLVKKDTIVFNITDQTAKVHSSLNLNGNKTTFNFSLPANTIAWSYYIGVDQGGQEAYEKATAQLTKYASPVVRKIPGYGPLAALALNGASYLTKLQKGEDIDFYILDSYNMNLYNGNQKFRYLKKGKVINDFSRMEAPLRGQYFVVLSNDNAITGVLVAVKITAIVVNEQWGNRSVSRPKIKARQEAYLRN